MTKSEFKIGDKVRSSANDRTYGRAGVIVADPDEDMPGVDFGHGFDGHYLGDSRNPYTCFWVNRRELSHTTPIADWERPATLATAAESPAPAADAAGLNALAAAIHELNRKWWVSLETGEPIQRNKGEMLCLIHSEISEAMEGERKDLQDDKLPHRKMAEVELADAVIRILDYAAGHGYDIGGAIFEKLEYNKTRADHQPEQRRLANGKKF